MRAVNLTAEISDMDAADIAKYVPQTPSPASSASDDSSRKDKATGTQKSNRSDQASGRKSGSSFMGSAVAGQDSARSAHKIRCATVDNFQGEESDIVIASLVRSNTQGNIGFLSEPERVNVLISRARFGLILIGDANVLQRARNVRGRQLWSKLIGLLDHPPYVGVPTKCSTHGKFAVCATAKDFLSQCPDGGCDIPCKEVVTSCTASPQHLCQRKCHPLSESVHKAPCKAEVSYKCDRNLHVLKRPCSGSPSPCNIVTETKCPRGHPTQRRCLELDVSWEIQICKVCEKQTKILREKEAALQEARKKVEADRLAEEEMLQRLELDKVETEKMLLEKLVLLEVKKERELREEHLKERKAKLEYLERSAEEFEKKNRGRIKNKKVTSNENQAMKEAISTVSTAINVPVNIAGSTAPPPVATIDPCSQPYLASAPTILSDTSSQTHSSSHEMGLQGTDSSVTSTTTPSLRQDEPLAPGIFSRTPSEYQLLESTYGTKTTAPVAGSAAGSEITGEIESQRDSALRPSALGSKAKFQDKPQHVSCTLQSVSAALDCIGKCDYAGGVRALQNVLQAEPDNIAAQTLEKYLECVLGEDPKDCFHGFLCIRDEIIPPNSAGIFNECSNNEGRGFRVTSIATGTTAAVGSRTSTLAATASSLSSSTSIDLDLQALGHYVYFFLLTKVGMTSSAHLQAIQFNSLFKQKHIKNFPATWIKEVNDYISQLTPKPPSKIVSSGHAQIKESNTSSKSSASRHISSVNASSATHKNDFQDSNGSGKAKKDWYDMKLQYPREAANLFSIEELMDMTGLESVKRAFLDIFAGVQIGKKQGLVEGSLFNAIFYGNPGTGKTTVARLYAQMLQEVGILPETAEFEETSGSALASEGLTLLRDNLLDKAKKNGGCALFIDEAYQLDPANDRGGKQVLDFLLPHMASLKGEFGTLVVILAGYSKHMEKLLEHNPGLPDRFPKKFIFEDYSNPELLAILKELLKNKVKAVKSKKQSKKSPQGPTASDSSQKRSSLSPNRQGGMQSLFANSGSYLIPPLPYSNYMTPNSNVYHPFSSHETKYDKWNHPWTFDFSDGLWKDEYGNCSGYGPEDIGSSRNPLMDPEGREWIFDRPSKLWTCKSDPRKTSKLYPGDTPTPKDDVSIATSNPFVCDEIYLRIAVRRLARLRGTPAFANARAITNLFNLCRSRQSKRLTQFSDSPLNSAKLFELTREDILGPVPDIETFKTSDAYQALKAMEGIQEVKNEVDKLLKMVVRNAKDELKELKSVGVNLNRVLIGNPGTGKTTVGKLYGQILRDFGLLSKGEVIFKTASDFVGSALGQSEKITREILNASTGCVLIIDEAYSLCDQNGVRGKSDPYRTAVIDTLVEQIQAQPGDDRAVLLLGYKDDMERMFREVNPGLSRRFQADNPIVFRDYDDNALLRILRSAAAKQGFNISVNTAVGALYSLRKARALPNFGNAGAVMNLLSKASINYMDRVDQEQQSDSVGTQRELLLEDFLNAEELKVYKDGFDNTDHLAGLVGCESIRSQLEKYKSTILLAQQLNCNPIDMIPFNFLFVGKPGTGKTTIARLMGRMLKSLGILPTDEVIERSASNFTTGFVGQAGPNTAKILQEASYFSSST